MAILWKERELFTSAEKKLLMELKSKHCWKLVKLPRKIIAIHCPARTKIEKNNKITQAYGKVCLKWPEVLGIVL